MLKKIISNNEKETKIIASDIAKEIDKYSTIALIGDLGAGKTVFAKAFAKSLGVKKEVTSPTFNILNNYNVNNNNLINYFCHVDTYRLKTEEELLDVGIVEYIKDERTVVLIEWADKVLNLLPIGTLIIEIKHQENNRQFVFTKKER